MEFSTDGYTTDRFYSLRLHYDLPGLFKDHLLPDRLDSISLSFLVDSMIKTPGGIAPNIAYSMSLLGTRSRLWATVGEDFEPYRQSLESKGIDTSGVHTIPGTFTASFFVNTDHDNAQIASFFPGAMAHAGNHSLRSLARKPDLVLISPNDPAAMGLYCQECQNLEIPYIYDPSQQIVRLTADDLRCGMESAIALFVNDYEYALIEKFSGLSADRVLENHPQAYMVVTKGKQGAIIHSNQGTYQIPCVEPVVISDPTGVGDAFRGGFLTGLHHGFPLEICGQMGVLAATYCLENPGAQGYAYTPFEFVNRFRQHFEDGGLLDTLLIS
jgi:adenosine kinase